jgi:hypothetical protein
MIDIDSNGGRIGQFWWINSNTSEPVWTGNFAPWVKRWCIRWGTCGFGRNVRAYFKPINAN